MPDPKDPTLFQDPKDQLLFQNAAPVFPDAGIYRTPQAAKVSRQPTLPQVRSGILNSPVAQNAYASFGIDGLKSILLQELVKLDWEPLQDELVYLAEGANQHTELKRALRATKLLALQWLDDPRRNEADKLKCQYICDSISTFGKIEIKPPDTVASRMEATEFLFPSMGPLEPIGAEVEHILSPGAGVLLITDLQGHYDKLKNMLFSIQLATEKDDQLMWTAPRDIYLVIVGDLFNKSPYSSWGDSVGWESYKLFKTLQRFMKVAPDRILMSYGAYDLDLAIGAAFDHPVSGQLGDPLGVNAQAQAIPALMSFIHGTSDPTAADCAWEHLPEAGCWLLKEDFQIQGFPILSLPDHPDGGPDITPLMSFYEALYQRLTHPQLDQRPRSIQDIDSIAAGLLPESSELLNLQNLATSLGRSLHYKGLLEGAGALGFLRDQVAGIHVLRAGELELFAMHPEIQEISLDMLESLKPRGLEAWHPPELEQFIRNSRVLPQNRINTDRLLTLLHSLRISRLNDWLGLSEIQFYQKLVQTRQLGNWVPDVLPRQDEKGFTEAWRKLRWDLINEDTTGIAGYAINMDGIARRGEPLMRKMAQLDERTRRSYARTFLMDLLREEMPTAMKIQQDGIVIDFPDDSNPSMRIMLLIDDAVAIYRDPKDNLHMPVKHAAWIEYFGA